MSVAIKGPELQVYYNHVSITSVMATNKAWSICVRGNPVNVRLLVTEPGQNIVIKLFNNLIL